MKASACLLVVLALTAFLGGCGDGRQDEIENKPAETNDETVRQSVRRSYANGEGLMTISYPLDDDPSPEVSAALVLVKKIRRLRHAYAESAVKGTLTDAIVHEEFVASLRTRKDLALDGPELFTSAKGVTCRLGIGQMVVDKEDAADRELRNRYLGFAKDKAHTAASYLADGAFSNDTRDGEGGRVTTTVKWSIGSSVLHDVETVELPVDADHVRLVSVFAVQ